MPGGRSVVHIQPKETIDARCESFAQPEVQPLPPISQVLGEMHPPYSRSTVPAPPTMTASPPTRHTTAFDLSPAPQTFDLERALEMIEHTSNSIREFVRLYYGLPLRPMIAPTFVPTLAEVEDMMSRSRLQLQYLSIIHDEVIARHIEYGRQTVQGGFPQIIGSIKPPLQILSHASCGGTTSIHVRKPGRNVPRPGYCHQCACIESPEWRRGPEGLRSLCNACGLASAKRKRRKIEAIASTKWRHRTNIADQQGRPVE